MYNNFWVFAITIVVSFEILRKFHNQVQNSFKKIFVWSFDCDAAFNLLKQLLLTYPVLRQPDVSRPFTVYTDASGYALGGILAQNDDSNQESVCQYASCASYSVRPSVRVCMCVCVCAWEEE